MFKRAYATQTQTVTIENPSHVVRDNRTKVIIATGDYAKCKRYLDAFGLCYIETAA